ncbi:MAG: hypothetical protein MJ170_00070 [Alphaproteobacteria bacterium]|nr:hypothetical protein [Alphaproteobacteria bacterium]
MKKLVSVIAGAVVLSSGAIAAPTMVKSNANDGGYVVTYDYADKPVSDWYMTLRAELAFWNFKATASASLDGYPYGDETTENYSFKPVFGGNLSVGKWFDSNWRADVEAGYLGRMTDKDSGGEYAVQIPYATVNGYYNFINGLYVGAGVGAAMPIITIDAAGTDFVESNRNKFGFGFMGGVMFGYSTQLNDNMTFDIRYRLAGITGTSHERVWRPGDGTVVTSKVENGFMLSNSLSFGLRYNF